MTKPRSADKQRVPNPANVSLWVQGATPPPRPRLEGDGGLYDVVVIGGGITGLSAALFMAEAGQSVALLEADQVAMGASGYNTGKVTVQHGLKYAQLESIHGLEAARLYAKGNADAVGQVAGLVETRGIECGLRRCGAHVFAERESDREALEAEYAAAQRAGLDYQLVEQSELPFEVALSLRVGEQLRIDPYRYCLGLLREAESMGVRVFEQSRVRDFKTGEPFAVATEHGRARGHWVVLATQLPFLNRAGLFATTRAVRSYIVALELRGQAPQDVYISAGDPTRSVRTTADGRALLIAGEDHDVGAHVDNAQRYEALEAWGRERFDVGARLGRWSSQDYHPADYLPYVGRMSLVHDRALTATGFAKWGLSNGTLAANILMHEVVGRPHPCAELLDARRLNPIKSAPKMLKDNLKVARHFIGDRIEHLREDRTLEDLGPGEGGLVRRRGRLVAAYRGEDGALSLVSPVCSHMGCHVNWNEAEKSWDCPCHGSRFSATGRVLQGPALKDLRALDAEGGEAPDGEVARGEAEVSDARS